MSSDRTQRTKKKRFDIDEIKAVRDGSKSALESLDFENNDDDVYELVDDDAYAEIVENRRKAGDFVVDDDGLGYHDNGEEFIGGEDGLDAKRRAQQEIKAADSRMAKKARKLGEDSAGQKNTILRHLQSVPGAPRVALKERAPTANLDIDALMGSASKPPAGRATAPRLSAGRALLTSKLPSAAPKFSSPMTREPASSLLFNDYEDDNHGFAFTPDDAMDVSHSAHVDDDAQSTPLKVEPVLDNAEYPSPAPVLSLSTTTKKMQPLATPPPKAAQPLPEFHAPQIDLPSFGDLNSAPSPGGDLAGKIEPSSWLKQSTTEQGVEEYVDMFFMDAFENNGLIYLFGRVPVGEKDAKNNQRTVSACAIVHGCERNLFVLPRIVSDQFKDDKPLRRNMQDVYQEVNRLLTKTLPKQEGKAFKCKPVKRRYAFEESAIPREETEYLKVVYSAKYPAPPADACTKGGETIERIFGNNSSPLELFLLKRQIKGPSWIRIRRPKMNPDVASWCKIEFAVENPKLVQSLTGGESAPQTAPTLSAMSVAIKTIVNPSTHVHEIVAIAGVTHSRVDADASSSGSLQLMKPFAIVRPLGLSCGNAFPSCFPHDMEQEMKKCHAIQAQCVPNERALLSLFFAKVQKEDPDIFAAHNLAGFEFDLLLHRALANKLNTWSLFGRLKKSKAPKSINDRDASAGRILCDTYKAAKEFLARETTYSLTHLAMQQLQQTRQEIDPVDVPRWFSSAQNICALTHHTFNDAMLVQGLLLKLQVVPLTKQLTNISGNLWSRTVKGARAERIEFLLLHEFHAAKYILPEKKFNNNDNTTGGKKGNKAIEEDEDGDDGVANKVGGVSRKRQKAAYSGGLVLEPKRGLYDTYILLLDFNSLYPSIIQEYNLCFTTIDWTRYMGDSSATATTDKAGNGTGKAEKTTNKAEAGSESESDEDAEENNANKSSAAGLPPLPTMHGHTEPGILPRVIKGLVDRRRTVKNMLKTARDAAEYQQFDIRQKALKLTANSMYGCLGFSFSRFYARPIAALVTAMGREALQRTVNLATNQLSLNVIYGDTDSVMINTGLNDLAAVKEIGFKVKREVNKLYKSLELDLDGIFRSMLLLKKKKYAALVVKELPNGAVEYEKEMKGLDLVRRDWCPLSKDTGKFVVDQILSGNSCEEIVLSIHEHLTELASRVRAGAVDLDQFVVTKGLNKNPKDYPDCNGQAHLQVALRMLKTNKPVNVGDHIPYVICKQPEGATPAHRAYHPDEIRRAAEGELTVDYEWYMSYQLLPPIARLCEPIEGTSQAILSEKLGLDASKYARSSTSDDLLDDGWGFTPNCMLDDSERFRDCAPLQLQCGSCNEMVSFVGVMGMQPGKALACTHCGSELYGRETHANLYCYISNRITLQVRECTKKYYDNWLVCDDSACGRRTMQQSMRCIGGCRGRMLPEYTDHQLYTQLKYLESLFDLQRVKQKKNLTDATVLDIVPQPSAHMLELIKKHMSNSVDNCAYNWVRASLWSTLFGTPSSDAKSKGIRL